MYYESTKLVPASSQEFLYTFVPVCLISCHHIGPHRSITVCISAQREKERERVLTVQKKILKEIGWLNAGPSAKDSSGIRSHRCRKIGLESLDKLVYNWDPLWQKARDAFYVCTWKFSSLWDASDIVTLSYWLGPVNSKHNGFLLFMQHMILFVRTENHVCVNVMPILLKRQQNWHYFEVIL